MKRDKRLTKRERKSAPTLSKATTEAVMDMLRDQREAMLARWPADLVAEYEDAVGRVADIVRGVA